jgi:hypothetical protein
MSILEELESALRSGDDSTTLEVYADYLQSTGDLRGEIIATDLLIDKLGPSPEMLSRRDELYDAWLAGARPPGTFRYGFLHIDAAGADPIGILELGLRGPWARLIRSVRIAATQLEIERAISLLAKVESPWLIRLAIIQHVGEDMRARSTLDEAGHVTLLASAKPLSNDRLKQLLSAAPHMQSIEIAGINVFASLRHATLKQLRVTGYDAICDFDVALPSLEELDLAFLSEVHKHGTAPPAAMIGVRLTAQRMPQLTRLDLSRNEPGSHEPHNLGGPIDVFRYIKEIPMRRQLTSLRLPSLRTETQAANLRLALREMPSLRDLEIVRVYRGKASLAQAVSAGSVVIRIGESVVEQ